MRPALAYFLITIILSPVIMFIFLDAVSKGNHRKRAHGRREWYGFTTFIMIIGVFGLALVALHNIDYVFASICGVGAGVACLKISPKVFAAIAPPFDVRCGQCGKAIPWEQPWMCPVCDRLSGAKPKTSESWSFLWNMFYDPFEGTVLDRCGAKDCGNAPSAVCCPKCGGLVALAAEPGDAAHAAHFPAARPLAVPPVLPRESEEQKKVREEMEVEEKRRKERERKAEEVRWKTEMDNMIAESLMAERRKLEAKAKRDAAKPKSTEDRKREEVEREGREQQIVSEWAAAERAKAKQIADPEERQRRLEEIQYLTEKHSV